MSNKILVKAKPTLSNNILIRKEIAVQQLVGGGTKPTFGDMYGAFRGRGTKPGTKVGIGGRLRGLAGMGIKAGAMAATAQATAEAMQGGNIGAPFQAGVTYQGLDPTATMNPKIAQQIEGRKENQVGVTSIPLPAAGGAANDPKLGQSQFRNQSPAMAKIRQERLGLTGPPPAPAGPIPLPVAVAPAQQAPAPVAPAQQAPAPVAPAQQAPAQQGQQPVSTQPDFNNMNATILQQGQQPVSTAIPPTMPQPPVSTATPPNMGLPQAQQLMGQEQQPQHGSIVNPVHYGPNTPPGQEYPQPDPFVNVNWKAFTDTVFDKLGPDMVYKMTPHQIATLSAYMYLKLS